MQELKKTPLRRRITPSVPLCLRVDNADGSAFEINFRLSYDFNAMALVEEQTGLSMMSGDIFENPSARKTTVLLWAGVQNNHPDYAGQEGLDAIGTYLNMDSAAKALIAVTEAFFASLPKEKAEKLKAEIEAKKRGETPDPTPAVETAQAAS